jgi:ATP-dependent DNA ligase
VNASGKIRDSKSVLAPRELRFIEPMYAVAVQTVPEGKEWLYEVKFDGYRWLAGRDKNGATLWSHRGNLFTSQFPHIARACERLPADTLLDGEIVAVDKSGRISFNLLQHHRPMLKRCCSMRSTLSSAGVRAW